MGDNVSMERAVLAWLFTDLLQIEGTVATDARGQCAEICHREYEPLRRRIYG